MSVLREDHYVLESQINQQLQKPLKGRKIVNKKTDGTRKTKNKKKL